MGYNKKDLEEFISQVDSKVGIMVLAEANDSVGKPFYVYLSIIPSKYSEYVTAQLRQESIVFEEFGTVLKTGPGYPPPSEAMREMEEKHAFNHNFEQKFSEELIKQIKNTKGKYRPSRKIEKTQNYPYAKPEGES